jgi:hypothetical protein
LVCLFYTNAGMAGLFGNKGTMEENGII